MSFLGKLEKSWADLKALVSAKEIEFQYHETTEKYFIFAFENSLVYFVDIHKAGYEPAGINISQNTADRTDFENNYKASANGKITLKVITEQASGSHTEIVIRDKDNSNYKASVSAAGRLLVSQEPPEAPPGTTEISVTEYNNMSGTDTDYYTIPNGETVVIQRLSGSSEEANGGCAIELWYDSNGNGNGMTIIDVIHVNASSDQHDLSFTVEGNGTRRIALRRRRLGGGSAEIFGRWEGYY